MIRIDKLLVERKIFNSRNKAQEYIEKGYVICDGKVIDKPNKIVSESVNITIKNEDIYVSRGSYKLLTAIEKLNLDFSNKVLLDIGSSTGDFTQVLLSANVKQVIAIDIGKNQMHQSLKNNSKLLLFEETDFRTIDVSKINNVDMAVIDVSFISVTKLLEKLKEINNLKEIICLVKPQFEAGKDNADKYKGKVLDKQIHLKVITEIINSFNEIGFNISDLTYSKITGK